MQLEVHATTCNLKYMQSSLWSAQHAHACTHAGNTSLFELDTGRKLAVLRRHDEEVTSLVWMPHPSAMAADQQAGLMVTGSADGALMAWDVRQPREAALDGRLQGVR